MKRIISLLLLVCILSSCALLLVSCNGNASDTSGKYSLPTDVNYASVRYHVNTYESIESGYIVSAIRLNENFVALHLDSDYIFISHIENVSFMKEVNINNSKIESLKRRKQFYTERDYFEIIEEEYNISNMKIEGDFLVYTNSNGNVIKTTQEPSKTFYHYLYASS